MTFVLDIIHYLATVSLDSISFKKSLFFSFVRADASSIILVVTEA